MWFAKELFTNCTTNIFVFGSNGAGRHGKGASKFALNFCGAQYGNPFGLQGKSFAIPTKNAEMRVLPLAEIESYIRQFLHFAVQNPQLTFYIAPIGTGLAGYTDIQIAPMFKDAPPNCVLPSNWKVQDVPQLLVDKTSE